MSENKTCDECEHYTCISIRKIIKENMGGERMTPVPKVKPHAHLRMTCPDCGASVAAALSVANEAIRSFIDKHLSCGSSRCSDEAGAAGKWGIHIPVRIVWEASE